VGNPGVEDLPNLAADIEEVGREALAELCLHFARTLEDAAVGQVNMLELHRRERAFPGPRHQGERQQCTVT
jgi:hypothetical protein